MEISSQEKSKDLGRKVDFLVDFFVSVNFR